MAAKPSDLRRFWTFVQQRGICYLQITGPCRVAGGEMRIDGVDRNTNQRFATWEHLFARGRSCPQGVKRRECILLACRECNALKASEDLASPAQIDFAMTLARLWERIGSGAEHERAFAALAIPFVMVEGCPAIDKPLPYSPQPCGWIKRGDVRELREANPDAEFMERAPAKAKPKKSQATKRQRACQLGVTDPRYRPGAKFDQARALTLALEDDQGRREEVQREHARNRARLASARGGPSR